MPGSMVPEPTTVTVMVGTAVDVAAAMDAVTLNTGPSISSADATAAPVSEFVSDWPTVMPEPDEDTSVNAPPDGTAAATMFVADIVDGA